MQKLVLKVDVVFGSSLLSQEHTWACTGPHCTWCGVTLDTTANVCVWSTRITVGIRENFVQSKHKYACSPPRQQEQQKSCPHRTHTKQCSLWWTNNYQIKAMRCVSIIRAYASGHLHYPHWRTEAIWLLRPFGAEQNHTCSSVFPVLYFYVYFTALSLVSNIPYNFLAKTSQFIIHHQLRMTNRTQDLNI